MVLSGRNVPLLKELPRVYKKYFRLTYVFRQSFTPIRPSLSPLAYNYCKLSLPTDERNALND